MVLHIHAQKVTKKFKILQDLMDMFYVLVILINTVNFWLVIIGVKEIIYVLTANVYLMLPVL